jgi:hypothetical protein
MPIENEGTEVSTKLHWERSILLNDLMTSYHLKKEDGVLSEFDYALLKDSGWYEVMKQFFF